MNNFSSFSILSCSWLSLAMHHCCYHLDNNIESDFQTMVFILDITDFWPSLDTNVERSIILVIIHKSYIVDNLSYLYISLKYILYILILVEIHSMYPAVDNDMKSKFTGNAVVSHVFQKIFSTSRVCVFSALRIEIVSLCCRVSRTVVKSWLAYHMYH